MHYHRKPRWIIPEREVTPEACFLNRRTILAGMAGIGLSAALPRLASAATGFSPEPQMNPSFADAGRAVTEESINSTYNNFYEFGMSKSISRQAEALETDPWTVKIDGMVDTPMEIGMEDLLKRMPLEERIVRHRCVEAWSMVVPWIGFPLSELIGMAGPSSDAKYVRMETFKDPEIAPGQRQTWYPWPYVEGLTVEEAMNPLAFMVVGAYGKDLPKSMGAPMRLHLPWKFGFKSVKSVVRISFTDEQPSSFWEALQSSEYGFWANVNPKVPHPRWSQAEERVLGTGDQVPTQLFNGYAEEVASLYAGMDQDARTLWY
ncbi:protein-methionine-sulfoxide reductase catalytic subunit MsrP [Paroceanicella profunda]|uniref:Protein-methionine-sulfoxide reductase catalytic subunit MsrP n=1 Tax=Paroceanicella profunda TaxID=2579971 RepID=A0A5B8FX97_9RHOB|nr:protein-methionine-sulfoxide reductase catalytic subunit MsrP [Paroceanicella profunda]QDL92224.1 protein-methionine-sulfoxide reductase catalytic subunit MsrP [Paroceanicella profunda]